MTSHTAPAARLVTNRAEADTLLAEMQEVMDALLALIAAETRLVRASKLREATRLEADKQRLVRGYAAASSAIKTNAEILRELMPERIGRLRRRHEAFREELRLNMAVLSTAKAVSENLLRGLSDELAAGDRPSGYGPGAQAPRPPLRVRPLAVNRSL